MSGSGSGGLFPRHQLDMIDLQAGVFPRRQGIHVGQLQALWRCGQVRVERSEGCQRQFHCPRLPGWAERGRRDVHFEFPGEDAPDLLGAESETNGLRPLCSSPETELRVGVQHHGMLAGFPGGEGHRVKHQPKNGTSNNRRERKELKEGQLSVEGKSRDASPLG